MTDSSHWTYIALAYGATFAIVGVLIWRIVGEYWRLLAELARFENDGEQR